MRERVSARPTSNPTWRWYLTAGTVVIAVYVLPVADFTQPAMTFLIRFSVLVAVALGVRRYGPRTRRPWILLVLGLPWLTGYALNIAGPGGCAPAARPRAAPRRVKSAAPAGRCPTATRAGHSARTKERGSHDA